MADAQDQRFMQLAVRLAANGLGRTGDNPSVGCVIVRETDDGVEVLGRGRTGDGGTPHGERLALERAGDNARCATLYVTLEPCSHFGKTTPCADAIIAAGINRVVVAVADPNPDVSGAGLKRLTEAGIQVETGVLANDALWLAAGHLLRMRQKRPFVQLKFAVSKDGLVAPGDGAPQWVTGDLARRRGHLLRAEVDGILVGLGTVAADNPSLDCRLPGLEEFSPIPIVLDSQLRIDPSCRLVANSQKNPLHVFCAPLGDDDTMQTRSGKLCASGVHIHEVEALADNGLAIDQVLRSLHTIGITRLMVEGGPRVSRSFEAAGLVDEVVIFRGHKSLKGRGLLPLMSHGLEVFGEPGKWQTLAEFSCGRDTMMVKRSRKTIATLSGKRGGDKSTLD